MTPNQEITERVQHFLKVLIERYIRDGQPVGSKTLAKDAGMDLSPATIRNVMSDLERAGLIASPHTSAGRVPTASGYRLFVDSLISLQPVNREEITRLRGELVGDTVTGHLVKSASKLLSGMTHMAGVVLIPGHSNVHIRELQFVALSETRILAVIVTHQGEVLNRIIDGKRIYSRAELEQASNFINRHYAGMELQAIKDRIVREMGTHREDMDKLMSQALTIADQALQGDEQQDFVVTGQTNLMDFDELAHMDRIRKLFDAFSEKQEILHLLERCSKADGVQLYIGEESGYGPLEKCSVVTAPYEVESKVVGVLGVIGPTRMAYERVIPIVDVTAKLLGTALKSSL